MAQAMPRRIVRQETWPLLMAIASIIVLLTCQVIPLGSIHVARTGNGPTIITEHEITLWTTDDSAWSDGSSAPGVALIQLAAPLTIAALLAAAGGTYALVQRRWLLGGGLFTGTAISALGGALLLTWGLLRYGDTFDAAGSGIVVDGTLQPSFGLLIVYTAFAFTATAALTAFACGTPQRPATRPMPHRQRIPSTRPLRSTMVASVIRETKR